MEIRITDSAAKVLKDKLNQKSSNYGVRIYIAGIGWGGPRLGIALDEQKNDDKVYEVNGIKVLLDSDIAMYTKGFEIDYRNSFFGKGFSVEQLYSTNTCR